MGSVFCDYRLLCVSFSVKRMLTYSIVFAFACMHLPFGLAAQESPGEPIFTSNVIPEKSPASSIEFSGFYRFYLYGRNQHETFPNNSGKTLALIAGDLYREPMLLLKLKGLSRERIRFSADFMINSIYKGSSQTNQSLTLDLGLNLETTFLTDYGRFRLRSGGVAWYRQSRLTVWGNRSLNRMSLFERRPQTAVDPEAGQRYERYYANGLIDEGIRYGSRAFQGIFLEGKRLPMNFSFKGVIGKSNFNRSAEEGNDNFTACARLQNELNDSLKVSYNFLQSFRRESPVAADFEQYSISTSEVVYRSKNWTAQLEAGWGRFANSQYDLGGGEAVLFNLRTNKNLRVPMTLQLYRISPQFVNVTGNFLNTTVLEVFPNVAGVGATIRTPYQGPMVGLQSPANNRQGASLNFEWTAGRLKLNAGMGCFAEIDSTENGLTYLHNVNGQMLARLYLFGQRWGPYNALNSNYRGTYEEVNIFEEDGITPARMRKFFSVAEVQAKWKSAFERRNIYVFALGRVNTCQPEFNPVPVLDDEALLRQYSSEIDVCFEWNSRTVFVMNYGVERIRGNQQTDVGDNGEFLARNQTSRLLGWGMDWSLSKRATLFLRHAHYRYSDPNFLENYLSGTESTLEIKVMF